MIEKVLPSDKVIPKPMDRFCEECGQLLQGKRSVFCSKECAKLGNKHVYGSENDKIKRL